jgi:DNA-binding transcriptional MerR regulator
LFGSAAMLCWLARYRMKQLCEMTGMSRQAIHFYIKKGLVPPGIKHGETSAEYTDEHVERIRLVRRMKEEQFLPLDAIKATLDQRDQRFTPAQRRVLSSVRREFTTKPARARTSASLGIKTVQRRTGADAGEIEQLIEAGLVRGYRDDNDGWRVAHDDVWLVERWSELSALGFSADNGFSPADLLLYAESVDALVQREADLVLSKLSEMRPEELSAMIERVLPILGSVLARLHDRAVRKFLDDL